MITVSKLKSKLSCIQVLWHFRCDCIDPLAEGHGMSEGIPMHVDSFDEYVDDALQHAKLLLEKYQGSPLFLLGHSMVRLACYLYILEWLLMATHLSSISCMFDVKIVSN